MELHPSYSRLLSAFHAERVKFLIVGGYAMALHGHVRYTHDLDLWVETSEENALAIEEALKSCGVVLPPTARSNLRSSTHVIRVGMPPVVIDLMTSVSGLEFNACFGHRLIRHLGNLEIPTLSLADLRTGKKASGRLQDLADLENLPET